MTTRRDKSRLALLVCAGLICLLNSAVGVLAVLWGVDLQHPKPSDLSTAVLLFLEAILLLPLFLSGFVSQRWHSHLMWLLACLSFAGVYFEGGSLWNALRMPFVLALIVIALLVEVA